MVRKCSQPECNKQAQGKGWVCVRHGAIVKKCSYKCSGPTCTNNSQKGGVCVTHGAIVKKYSYKCSDPTCPNNSQKGGVCVTHGAIIKKYSYKCSDPTCTSNSQKGGVCRKHGAKVKKHKCGVPTCTNISRKGGVCWSHGAKQTGKKCSEPESHGNVKTQDFPSDRHPTKNLQLTQHDLMCCQYEDIIPKLVVIVQGSTSLMRSLGRVKVEENMDCQVAAKGAICNPTKPDDAVALQGVNPNMARNTAARKRGNSWV